MQTPKHYDEVLGRIERVMASLEGTYTSHVQARKLKSWVYTLHKQLVRVRTTIEADIEASNRTFAKPQVEVAGLIGQTGSVLVSRARREAEANRAAVLRPYLSLRRRADRRIRQVEAVIAELDRFSE